jgi:hypothetical protein
MSAATKACVIAFAALALAALLNAQGLRKTAEIQPAGLRRDVALALTRPLARLSHLAYLDRPRHELQLAIGRGEVDRIDTRVVLAAPLEPPAKPRISQVPVARRSHRHPKPRRRKPAVLGHFTRSHPLRVWVAGDSLSQVPGQALERAVGSAGPVEVLGVESRLDTGLSRPDLYNWFTRFREVISQLRPNVAVLSFGADDAHDYMSGIPAGHTIGQLGSPSWVAEYRRRVEGVTRELNAARIYVVFLGLPVTRGPGYRRSFPVVNSVLSAVARRHARMASFVDTWRMFSKHGRYADYLPNGHGQLVLMRAPDGVHYEPAAGDAIARTVLTRLRRVYDLRR